MGAHVPGPHYPTYDPRTPNSLETWPFKTLLERFVDPSTMTLQEAGFEDALERYRSKLAAQAPTQPIALKHPMTAAVLPQISRAFDARLIFVMRPLDAIEATRVRRNWEVGSASSASLIYDRIGRFMDQTATPYELVDYEDLTADPAAVARRLAEFTGLTYCDEAPKVVRTAS
jgi:hypothetical protein